MRVCSGDVRFRFSLGWARLAPAILNSSAVRSACLCHTLQAHGITVARYALPGPANMVLDRIEACMVAHAHTATDGQQNIKIGSDESSDEDAAQATSDAVSTLVLLSRSPITAAALAVAGLTLTRCASHALHVPVSAAAARPSSCCRSPLPATRSATSGSASRTPQLPKWARCSAVAAVTAAQTRTLKHQFAGHATASFASVSKHLCAVSAEVVPPVSPARIHITPRSTWSASSSSICSASTAMCGSAHACRSCCDGQQVAAAERLLDGIIKSNEAELKDLKSFAATNTKIGCLVDAICAKIRTFATAYFGQSA